MPSSFAHLDLNNNEETVSALKSGKESAFDTVYRYYYNRLCAFCSQYIDEQEEIEEIVQETMIWLWENRDNLRIELSLKSLLFTITKNKAMNRISHLKVRRKVHQEIVDKYQIYFEEPDFYCSNELYTLYKRTLANLSPTLRETYQMSRHLNLTHSEIAQKQNVSIQTINYRIGQVLKVLRKTLKDYLPIAIYIAIYLENI